MTILTPQTNATQSFQLRTRPYVSYSAPFTCSLVLVNEETNVSQSITPISAFYNSNDFLVISASLNLKPNNFFKFQVFQMSGSVQCTELYRGEILPTTESATVRNSEPLLSYIDSSNDYIIYES
jgi:hypothetical protein